MENKAAVCVMCGKSYKVYEGEQNECPHCSKDSEDSYTDLNRDCDQMDELFRYGQF